MGQKAILTFENPGDGTINVKLEFDPKIKGNAPTDPAVHYALAALKVVQRESEESDDSDD